MRTIRASEIGTYLYCQRAWWYLQRGEASTNLPEMLAGAALHERHSRAALQVGCLRAFAYALLLLALVFITLFVANRLW